MKPFLYTIHVEMIWHDAAWEFLQSKIKEAGKYNMSVLCMISYLHIKAEDDLWFEVGDARVKKLAEIPNVEIGLHSHCFYPSFQQQKFITKSKLFGDYTMIEVYKPTHFVSGHWIYNQDVLDICAELRIKYFHVATEPDPRLDFHGMEICVLGKHPANMVNIHDTDVFKKKEWQRGVVD